MKLGIFDSGLGGLVIMRALRDALPDIDMVYMGDTLHLPYGNRSDEAIYEYSRRCIDYLFSQDCNLIVMACNTASAAALRKLQQQYLPRAYPGRNVIGVIVPTLEAAAELGFRRLGLIATNFIISSNIFEEELQKIDPAIEIFQQATPLLVPLIENDGMAWAGDILRHYLEPLMEAQIECLILGCTHYPFLKSLARNILGPDIAILSQDEIIPQKLVSYLERHPEYHDKMNREGHSRFCVSDLTANYLKAAQKIYGEPISVEKVQVA